MDLVDCRISQRADEFSSDIVLNDRRIKGEESPGINFTGK
jgi:hypothetical protein